MKFVGKVVRAGRSAGRTTGMVICAAAASSATVTTIAAALARNGASRRGFTWNYTAGTKIVAGTGSMFHSCLAWKGTASGVWWFTIRWFHKASSVGKQVNAEY